MVLRLNRFIRFIQLFSLFLSNNIVKGSFSQFAFENISHFNQAVFRVLDRGTNDPPAEDLDYSRNCFDIQQEDEDFSLVVSKKGDTFLILEKDYEEIIREIKDLRRKILSVGKSKTLKFELLQKIYDLYDDPTGQYSIPWREHVITLESIIRSRIYFGSYIPNCLLISYLRYFKIKVLTSNSLSDFETCERVLPIIHEMVKSPTKPEFIEILLKPVFSYLDSRQIYMLFESCHSMFRGFAQNFHKVPEKRRSYAIKRICTNYLLLLKYFNLDFNAFENLKAKIPTPAMFMPFFEIAIPYYRLLLLLPRRLDTINLPFINFEGTYFLEICVVLDFFIKQTNFNDNFLASSDMFILRTRIFHKIKTAFFRNIPLKNIIMFCRDYNLKYLLQASMIYSENNSQFTETVLDLIRYSLCKPKIRISSYACFIAYCPNITIELFEASVLKWVSEPDSKIKIDSPMIKSIRRLFLAIENIDTSEYWDMSSRFRQLIETDHHDPKDLDLLQAGRIYLFKLFGIPFDRTSISKYSDEDAAWSEMIGFVNLILEREYRRKNIEHFLRVKTHDKI